MSADDLSLEALRGQIDRIDASLHDLLMERASIVAQLSAAKGGTPSLRPAREMEVLRALADRHQGPMPIASVIRIWREIMATSLAQQMELKLFSFGGEDASATRELVRFHFGSSQMTELATPGHVVQEIVEHQGALGVVPVPTFEGAEPWWPSLILAEGDARPRVIARLPMFEDAPGYDFPHAFVLACQAQGPSGDDASLIGVQADESLGRAPLLDQLAADGIVAQLAAITPAESGERFMLIETAEFLREDDPRLAALATSVDEITRIKIIGGYGRPVKVSG